MKVKMELNVLEDKIDKVINASNTKVAKNEGYGICVGLDILNGYLQDIANRALKIGDPVIINSLIQINVLKPNSEEEEKKIAEAARKLEEMEKNEGH